MVALWSFSDGHGVGPSLGLPGDGGFGMGGAGPRSPSSAAAEESGSGGFDLGPRQQRPAAHLWQPWATHGRHEREAATRGGTRGGGARQHTREGGDRTGGVQRLRSDDAAREQVGVAVDQGVGGGGAPPCSWVEAAAVHSGE
ncbi:uncharacterized protein LOC120674719 [Panicum virgatum]|uniref:uncharacterized protein LOC120674719 n=1 Tax=Panicum virgatum TaxID=38727 RepID=UPI0019D669B2|nr:uncharacterized protein LOC120674719 [Panicum virgatum]